MRTAPAAFALALAVTGSAAPPPIPVTLNHLYIVVDTDTYEAIGSDPFLKERFAAFEARTTARADRTYTGEYFYGTNTYFEFFDAGNPGNGPRGKSGIAFGVDRPGDLASLEKQLRKQFNVDTGPITRGLADEQVPWFTILSINAPMQLSTWLMEYDAEFLQQWKPEAGGVKDGVRRRDILARYTASLGLADRPFLLSDVAGIVAAVDPQTRDSLLRFCLALGHQFASEGDDVVIRGPDFWLRLVDETEARHGIQRIRFNVRRAKAFSRRIGRSTLEVRSDGTADWSFDPFSPDTPGRQVRVPVLHEATFHNLLARTPAGLP